MPTASKKASRAPSHCALAIGGLDPGGGAGVIADLRAFAAAGAFGCAAIAAVTVQSTAGVRKVRALPASEVTAQVAEVLRHQRVRAVKVGVLASRDNVRALSGLLSRHQDIPVVVDTPIRATRGAARLLTSEALASVKSDLIPRATLLTVNLAEAQALLGERVRTVSEAHDAARALAAMGARAVLVKGGHMKHPFAVDVLAVDGHVVELRARRLAIAPTHGTGCTLASLVAGRLTLGATLRPSSATLIAAIRWGKRVHHAALARAVSVGGGMRVLVF